MINLDLPPARTFLPGCEAAGVWVAVHRQPRLVAPQHVRLRRRLPQCQVFHCKQTLIKQRLFHRYQEIPSESKTVMDGQTYGHDTFPRTPFRCLDGWICWCHSQQTGMSPVQRPSWPHARRPPCSGADKKKPWRRKSQIIDRRAVFLPPCCRCRRPAPPGRTWPRRRAASHWRARQGGHTLHLLKQPSSLLPRFFVVLDVQTIIFNLTLFLQLLFLEN